MVSLRPSVLTVPRVLRVLRVPSSAARALLRLLLFTLLLPTTHSAWRMFPLVPERIQSSEAMDERPVSAPLSCYTVARTYTCLCGASAVLALRSLQGCRARCGRPFCPGFCVSLFAQRLFCAMQWSVYRATASVLQWLFRATASVFSLQPGPCVLFCKGDAYLLLHIVHIWPCGSLV